MMGFGVRQAAAAALCVGLAGCVSSGPAYEEDVAHAAPRGDVLQCVPYVREHSEVKIWGDAYQWWDKAGGRYARTFSPSEGAVMVLTNYAGPNRGHVAVVREVTGTRDIRVDHANWLDDGAIYTDNPVHDVSPGNDWSLVRVFNEHTGAWGVRTYPVQGFIGPGKDDGLEPERSPDRTVPVAEGARKHDAIAALLADEDTDESGLN